MWSHQESAIIGGVKTPKADFVDPSPTEIRHRIGLAVSTDLIIPKVRGRLLILSKLTTEIFLLRPKS